MSDNLFMLHLDVVDVDGDDLAALIARSATAGVMLTVVALRGPGGGNPAVDVVAPRANLALWLLEEYVDWDGKECHEYLAEATTAK